MDGGSFFLIIIFSWIFYCVYKKSRRVTSIEDLPADVYGIKLSGIATSVSDGDGFKFFHTPWLSSFEDINEDKKLRIRLAGIDAPELASDTKPAQPFAVKAKNELSNLILRKKIKIKLLGKDRYNRLLAMCYVKGWLSSVNVNMKMVELGMACVYDRNGAVYDNKEDEFWRLEAIAKKKKLGMWSRGDCTSPMDYKNE